MTPTLDIVVTYDRSDADNVGIFLGYGNGAFGNPLTYFTGSAGLSVAVGDSKNDTRLDVIVASFGTHNLGVLLGHGNGIFGKLLLVPMDYGSHSFSVFVADFNSDRKLDLAVANSGTESLHIFLQTC